MTTNFYTFKTLVTFFANKSAALSTPLATIFGFWSHEISGLEINALSIFIGYYVVWSVTPSLHTPLMSVTNAISSVIIVGAIIAGLAGNSDSIFNTSSIFGFLAISLAAINIFGGFLVTQRMLAMYKKKKKDK